MESSPLSVKHTGTAYDGVDNNMVIWVGGEVCTLVPSTEGHQMVLRRAMPCGSLGIRQEILWLCNLDCCVSVTESVIMSVGVTYWIEIT